MPAIMTKAIAAAPDRITRRERLRRFLNAYWLRPENAMWMTLRSEVLSNAPLQRPSADLCCGDGIFTFLHAGGVLEPSFDVFAGMQSRPRQDRVTTDMFDAVGDEYRPAIVRAADRPVDVGMDLKRNLLEKAGRLGFYRRTMLHDCNHALPFADAHFDSIYCNSAYWVENVDGFLREVARALRPGGRAILHVKLAPMREFTLRRYERVLGSGFLDIVTGNRLDSWVSLADQSSWERRFRNAGLSIESCTPIAAKLHAQLWDVGLRPLAPMLIRLANSAAPGIRAEVKGEWVDLMLELATPLCDPKLAEDSGSHDVAELQYVLSRP